MIVELVKKKTKRKNKEKLFSDFLLNIIVNNVMFPGTMLAPWLIAHPNDIDV